MVTLVGLMLVGACTNSKLTVVAEPEALPWFGRTRGSAVVLSRDERIAVVTNRSAGVVTILELDPDQPLEQLIKRRTELAFDADSEPWAAVITADGNTAYVIARRAQTVTRIVDLRGKPTMLGRRRVGSEPTAIVMSPSGRRLFVANWGDGTISVVDSPPVNASDTTNVADDPRFKENSRLDLNKALAATGVLGSIEPRLGLAHPRALAITDDGDDEDGDETLYATEFFSMPLLDGADSVDAGTSPAPGYFDRNRQGFVYPIRLADDGKIGNPISIAPITDTGFKDTNDAVTGCFPNQLYAAAIDGDRLFVTSMCASPEGPLGPPLAPKPASPANFKTVMHPVLFVIDTDTNKELPEQRQVLTRELEFRYAADDAEAAPDELSKKRMPLIPNDIAFAAPSGSRANAPRTACVTAMGANAVFCMRRDSDGILLDIGSPGQRYIKLEAGNGVASGRLPVGIAISQLHEFALVASDKTQSVSVVDLKENVVRARDGAIELERAALLRDSSEADGHQLFVTGLDVWSLNGEARVSCEGCHPDGLSDGVTWFFARGPRRTLSTAGSYYGDGERRVLLWGGNVDEIHDVEGIVRSVAGGVGAVLWDYGGGKKLENNLRILYDGSPVPPAGGKTTSTLHNNLNASVKELVTPTASTAQVCTEETTTCDSSPVGAWDHIDAYVRTVRAPARPDGLDSVEVERGAEQFRMGRCAGCHGGPGWTLSRVFYTPGAENNGALPYARPTEVTDQQLGLLRTERYNVPEALRLLNPPGKTGTATLRRWDPPPERDRVVHLYGNEMADGYDSNKTHGGDQINCVLRAVGTFPSQADGDNKQGIVPGTSPVVVREVRADMTTLALGPTGFNIPSLVGIAAGAPYFHAGNARTLEELFDPAFAAHYQALAPGFLAADGADRESAIHDLIAYLLSIDDGQVSETARPEDDLCVPEAGVVLR
jgi:hypothetical protein